MRYFDVGAKKFVKAIPDGEYVVQMTNGEIIFSKDAKVLYVAGYLEFVICTERRMVRYELFGDFDPNAVAAAMDDSVSAWGMFDDSVWFKGRPNAKLEEVLNRVNALVTNG